MTHKTPVMDALERAPWRAVAYGCSIWVTSLFVGLPAARAGLVPEWVGFAPLVVAAVVMGAFLCALPILFYEMFAGFSFAPGSAPFPSREEYRRMFPPAAPNGLPDTPGGPVGQ